MGDGAEAGFTYGQDKLTLINEQFSSRIVFTFQASVHPEQTAVCVNPL